jgi:hypothetical protein
MTTTILSSVGNNLFKLFVLALPLSFLLRMRSEKNLPVGSIQVQIALA